MTDSSLCSLCSTQLVLDETSAGGTVLKEKGNVPVLYFPHAKEMEEKDELEYRFRFDIDETGNCRKCWYGRLVFEREVTPPDLPELTLCLPDQCKFCFALKEALLHRYKTSSWWEATTSKLRIEARYLWCCPRYSNEEKKFRDKEKRDGGHAFRLSSLAVTYSHPNLKDTESEDGVDRYPIMADPGKLSMVLLSCIGILDAYSSASRSL